jgi:colicin import membrane protein
MAEETDGVGETFDESLRIALTVASHFGERTARLREQFARNREASVIQEGRELTARFESERGAMRASLAPVQSPEWWEHARPEDIAQAHETATAWRDFDDVATGAGDTIRREVQERYGVDAPGADDTAAILAIAEAERDRADAAAERAKAGEELTAAQLLFARADRHEREQEASSNPYVEALAAEMGGYVFTGEVDSVDESGYNPWASIPDAPAAQEKRSQLYDSSDRRREFANALVAKGISEQTIAARVLADGENAKHPRAAVDNASEKPVRIRKRPENRGSERSRGGLSQ